MSDFVTAPSTMLRWSSPANDKRNSGAIFVDDFFFALLRPTIMTVTRMTMPTHGDANTNG